MKMWMTSTKLFLLVVVTTMLSIGVALLPIVRLASLKTSTMKLNNNHLLEMLQKKQNVVDEIADEQQPQQLLSCINEEISNFEFWFANNPKASYHRSIQHTSFGKIQLRGLRWTNNHDNESIINEKKKTTVITVPQAITLQTDYSNPDWDFQLAIQLWNEVCLGRNSSMYEYCSLLTKGWTKNKNNEGKVNYCPPSTAPDALRHWTEEEKKLLMTTESGRKLLQSQQMQEQRWRDLFKNKTMSHKFEKWEEFEWAMEAVRSRAFCGKCGPPLSAIGASILPIISTIYILNLDNNIESSLLSISLILGSVTMMSFILVLNSFFRDKGKATILPMIDSANHSDDANSSINYNPFLNEFTLTIGENCLILEDDQQTQLYINYGSKTDSELLLNYGFLPEKVKSTTSNNSNDKKNDREDEIKDGQLEDDMDTSINRYRRALAEAFNRCNL